MGQQTARRGHDDVGAHEHALFLLTPSRAVAAAVDDCRRKRQEVGETLELHVDLLGQFPRGYYDERSDHIVRIALAQQFVEERKGVGRRLAGSGLGAADQVAALLYDGNRMFLYRSHLLEVHRFESFHNPFVQIQCVESHIFSFLRLLCVMFPRRDPHFPFAGYGHTGFAYMRRTGVSSRPVFATQPFGRHKDKESIRFRESGRHLSHRSAPEPVEVPPV